MPNIAANPSADMRAQHLAEVQDLAHVLVDIVSEQRTHQVALEALMSAYASVAVCHPCCAQRAADLARNVASLIETAPVPQGATH